MSLRHLKNIFSETDLIEAIGIKSQQMEFIHKSQILEYLIEGLPFIKTADVMNSRLEQFAVKSERLQATTDLLVLFQHTHLISFL